MPSTGYKTDSLKRGDSSRELKGVSNKELNFIFYAAGEPLKILRQGTLWSALLLRKISLIAGVGGKDKMEKRRPIWRLTQ